MENKTIPVLDLVRFAAAAMVVWFHLAYFNSAFPQWTVGRVSLGSINLPELANTARWGWVGVEIFFVLSGFVICYSAQGKSAAAFALGRFLRLYPAVWICAPLTALILLWCRDTGIIRALIGSLVLFPKGPWVDGVYWTLGIEMTFYALIWLIILCRQFDKIEAALIVIGLPSTLFWYLYASGAFHGAPYDGRIFMLLLLRHGCYFALGGLIFQISRFGPSLVRLGFCAIFAGACLVEIMTGHIYGGNLTAAIVWSVAVAAIGAGVFANARIAALLPLGLVRKIGLATYPLYLFHDIPGTALLWLLRDLPDYLALAAAVAVVVGFSFVVLIPERALRDWLWRKFTAARE